MEQNPWVSPVFPVVRAAIVPYLPIHGAVDGMCPQATSHTPGRFDAFLRVMRTAFWISRPILMEGRFRGRVEGLNV